MKSPLPIIIVSGAAGAALIFGGLALADDDSTSSERAPATIDLVECERNLWTCTFPSEADDE